MKRTLLVWICFCSCFSIYALPAKINTSKHGVETDIHLGVSQVLTGKLQNIPVHSVPPARYSTNHQDNWNGLVGFSLLKDVRKLEHFDFNYGLSMFYLFKQSVSGEVFQAGLFNNLGYSYSVQNLPVYLHGKTLFHDIPHLPAFAIDIGVGPNVMKVSRYTEWRINPTSRLDNAFKQHTSAAFSATAGIALHFANVFDKAPMACGYRFFYLGSGELQPRNLQFLSALSTGSSFANALVCSLVI